MTVDHNPYLSELNRRTIGTNFMKRLCELDYNAEQNGRIREFDLNDIWSPQPGDNLGAYNQQLVAPYAIYHLQNTFGFIVRDPSTRRIRLTNLGRQNCGSDITLPPE